MPSRSNVVQSARAGGLCCMSWRFVLLALEVCAEGGGGLYCLCRRFVPKAQEVCAACAGGLC